MAHFFTSDTHFNHGNIIKYCRRMFCLNEQEQKDLSNGLDIRIRDESIRRMDEVLIEGINKTVGKDDHLWFLGDFLFARHNEYYRKCQEYLDRIECKNIHIIWGNHDDRVIGKLFATTDSLTMVAFRDDEWVHGEQAIHRARVDHDNRWQKVVLSHYAMAVWEKSHRATWQLYGHSHATAEQWLDSHMTGRRSVDVGVDNAIQLLKEYRPWKFTELKSLFADRKGFSVDVHGTA